MEVECRCRCGLLTGSLGVSRPPVLLSHEHVLTVVVTALVVLVLAVRIVKQYGLCSGWVGYWGCANPGCG